MTVDKAYQRRPVKLTAEAVTAVVCTKNSETTIRACLRGIHESGITDVLVVDGGSVDGTLEIVESVGARVIHDSGKGLGAARNLGAAQALGPLTFFVGPDDQINSEVLDSMLESIVSKNLVACSCIVRVDGETYIAKSMDALRKSLVRPGYADVLGTPTMYLKKYLNREPYSLDRRYSDDSEIFERLAKRYGRRFYIVEAESKELGSTNLSAVIQKYGYYGVSDYEIFTDGRVAGWSFARSVVSLLHPLRVQVWKPLLVLGFWQWLYFLPFLLLATTVRYSSWFGQVLRPRVTRRPSA